MTYWQNPYMYNYGYYPPMQMQQQPMLQQPAIYPQQQVVEQPTQTQSQQQSQETDSSYFIWVQGEAGAKSYPVARGTTVPLFDSEGDFVYIKSVDKNGVPLPLITKVLSDPPVEVMSQKVEQEQQNQDIDLSNYVTKDKYEELVNRVLELETRPTTPSYTSNFTGNTFNNSRKGKDDGNKLSI